MVSKRVRCFPYFVLSVFDQLDAGKQMVDDERKSTMITSFSLSVVIEIVGRDLLQR
jgi:hypothetical protein